MAEVRKRQGWGLIQAEDIEDGAVTPDKISGGGDESTTLFSLNKNAVNQSVSSKTDTLVTWSTIRRGDEADGIIDLSSGGITPTDGDWLFLVQLKYTQNIVDAGNHEIRLYVDHKTGNGHQFYATIGNTVASGTGDVTVRASAFVEGNGTSEYFIYARAESSGTKQIVGGKKHTFWEGAKI